MKPINKNKKAVQTRQKQLKTKPILEIYDISEFEILNDLVLVIPLRSGTDTPLVNPEQYDDKPEFGKVIKVGPDCDNLKPSNIIFFGKYSSLHVRSNTKDYYLVRMEDIMARKPDKK